MAEALGAILHQQVNDRSLCGKASVILISAEFFLPMRVFLAVSFHIAMNGMAASIDLICLMPVRAQGTKTVPESSDLTLRNVSSLRR